jgi:hypothetical protein
MKSFSKFKCVPHIVFSLRPLIIVPPHFDAMIINNSISNENLTSQHPLYIHKVDIMWDKIIEGLFEWNVLQFICLNTPKKNWHLIEPIKYNNRSILGRI